MFLNRVYDLLERVLSKLNYQDVEEIKRLEILNGIELSLEDIENDISGIKSKLEDVNFSGFELHRTDDRLKELIKEAMEEYKNEMVNKEIKKTVRKK